MASIVELSKGGMVRVEVKAYGDFCFNSAAQLSSLIVKGVVKSGEID